MQFKENYRGVDIELDNYGTFIALDNGEFGEFRSEILREAREWIDKKIAGKAVREKKAFKRIPVYFDYRGPLREGEITSIADTTSYRGAIEVWVSFKDEKGKLGRLKASLIEVYRLEPGTTIVFERINDRKRQIKELETANNKDMNALRESARITEEDISGYQDKEV